MPASMNVVADPPHIMVATPCYGSQLTASYVTSALALQRSCLERGIRIQFKLLHGQALITRARADLVAEFLQSEATHLFFVDADIGFAPDQALRLLAFDADVTAAAYPQKRIDWERVRTLAGSGRADIEAAALDYVIYFEDAGPLQATNGFIRVRYAGAGFLLIRRSALLRLCEAHPELRYKAAQRETDLRDDGPYRYALFECLIDPETGHYLSEDYAFCRRWRDLGGAIWLDMHSRLTHTGTAEFRGDLENQFVRIA
jgi:hypothetical protein